MEGFSNNAHRNDRRFLDIGPPTAPLGRVATSDGATQTVLPSFADVLHHPFTYPHSSAPYGVFRSEAISVVCFLIVQA
jgi:hypothetical protein